MTSRAASPPAPSQPPSWSSSTTSSPSSSGGRWSDWRRPFGGCAARPACPLVGDTCVFVGTRAAICSHRHACACHDTSLSVCTRLSIRPTFIDFQSVIGADLLPLAPTCSFMPSWPCHATADTRLACLNSRISASFKEKKQNRRLPLFPPLRRRSHDTCACVRLCFRTLG